MKPGLLQTAERIFVTRRAGAPAYNGVFSSVTRQRYSVCFVDDDPAELRRFRENLQSEFVIGAGRTLDEAMADLRKSGRERPDLFVLDMYFPDGPFNTEEELSELRAAWDRFQLAQADFTAVRIKLRQTSRGGLRLAEELRLRHRSGGYVFFTRKATLEEGLAAIRQSGAVAVIKKPDAPPGEGEGRPLMEAYDAAFRDHAQDIAEQLTAAIRRTSWWWNHRASVCAAAIAFALGCAACLLARPPRSS